MPPYNGSSNHIQGNLQVNGYDNCNCTALAKLTGNDLQQEPAPITTHSTSTRMQAQL